MAPSTKVKEITRLVSMPSRLAMCMSCEQAREARPMREYLMNSVSATISTTVTTMIMMREYGTVTSKLEPMWNCTAPETSAGTVYVARALPEGDPVLQEDRHADGRDQRHQAGLPRTGRYATRSTL